MFMNFFVKENYNATVNSCTGWRLKENAEENKSY